MAQTSEHPRSCWPDEISECIKHREDRGSSFVREVDTGIFNGTGIYLAAECLGVDWLLFLPNEKNI